MIRRILILAAIVGLSGCVSEQSYVSDKGVQQVDFDRQQAAKSRVVLGLSYLQQQNFVLAKENLDMAMQHDPSLLAVHAGFAHYYQVINNAQLAKEYFLSALNIEPNNPDTLNNYGSFLCQQGLYLEAKPILLKASNQLGYHKSASSLHNLAMCAYQQKNYVEAIEFFLQSLQHDPANSRVLLQIAQTYYVVGNDEQAWNYYKRFNYTNQPSAQGWLFGVLLTDSLSMPVQKLEYVSQLERFYNQSKEWQGIQNNDYKNHGLIKRREEYKSLTVADVTRNEVLPGQALNVEQALPQETVSEKQTISTSAKIISNKTILTPSISTIEIPSHVVQAGENLFRISVKYNIQISTLKSWNKLSQDSVNKGQRLYLKNPDIYFTAEQTIKLSVVAKQLGVDLALLMKWNNLKQDGLLKAGTKIIKRNVEQY